MKQSAPQSTNQGDRLFDQLVGGRRMPVDPLAGSRRRRVIVASLALAALAVALAAGSQLLRQPPVVTVETQAPSVTPSETARPGERAWVIQTDPTGASLRVEYVLLPGSDVRVGEDGRYLSLTIGDAPYGFSSESVAAPKGRGIRIIDASTVRPHFNNNTPLGDDAAAFMDGLNTNRRLGDVIGPVRLTTLAGLPALSADLLPERGRVHMDTAHGLSVDLWPPSRLIVADLDAAIILVQVWADSESALASWLEESRPLLDSLRIQTVPEPAPS